MKQVLRRAMKTLCGILLVTVFGVACGSTPSTAPKSAKPVASAAPSPAPPAAPSGQKPSKVYVVKWSVGQSPTDPVSVAARQLQTDIEQATHGGLKVELYYTGQLGSNPAVLSETMQGAVQMFTGDPNFLVKYWPSAGFSDVPYLFASNAQAYQFWDGPIGSQVKAAILTHTGLRVLNAMAFGFHSLWTRNRRIASLADLKGLKVQSTPSKVYLTLWKDLGAQAVVMSLGQDYTAAEQHVIDAVDLSPSSGSALKLYEVMKYFTFTRDNFSTALTMVNEKFYRTLPAGYQKLLASEAQKIQGVERKDEVALESKDVALMEKNGVHVTHITSAQRDRFIAAVAPLYRNMASLLGPSAAKWLKEWRSTAGKG